jgi:hypothetical protein
MQESLHGIDKDRIYPLTLQAAGLAQTEDAFNKTVTLVTASPKTALAPQNGISQGTFRMIVGRRHPFFLQFCRTLLKAVIAWEGCQHPPRESTSSTSCLSRVIGVRDYGFADMVVVPEPLDFRRPISR